MRTMGEKTFAALASVVIDSLNALVRVTTRAMSSTSLAHLGEEPALLQPHETEIHAGAGRDADANELPALLARAVGDAREDQGHAGRVPQQWMIPLHILAREAAHQECAHGEKHGDDRLAVNGLSCDGCEGHRPSAAPRRPRSCMPPVNMNASHNATRLNLREASSRLDSGLDGTRDTPKDDGWLMRPP